MSMKLYKKDSLTLTDIFDLVEKVKANPTSGSTFKFGGGITLAKLLILML